MRKKSEVALIIAEGFIGDNIFATSVAERFVNLGMYRDVMFLPSVPAINCLLEDNPYISHVLPYGARIRLSNENTTIFRLHPIHRREVPTVQYQKQCGIHENLTRKDYKVYINENTNLYTESVENQKIVVYQNNWKEKSFEYTSFEYWNNNDVPNLGYGGRRRNDGLIVSDLKQSFPEIKFIPVGKENGYNVKRPAFSADKELLQTAHLIKNADLFIGAEGGLSNLAAGLGTPTVITGDFIHQLYGPRGVLEQNDDPMLGPVKMFDGKKHCTLNPYFSDYEVINAIKSYINVNLL